MPIQLDVEDLGLFDILYGVEPPNNTRGPGRGSDSEVLTDDIALRVRYERIFRAITEATNAVQLTS